MPQTTIPAVVYRGGTSRGIFFHKKDLPDDTEARARIFQHGIDSWNVSQVDGLGAGTTHTSKCVVISPSETPGVHINYTFYQVGIGRRIADATGTCGNLMAASAVFAVDEGLVPVLPDRDSVTVSVYDTNAAKNLTITVPLDGGEGRESGACAIPGIVRTGAPIVISILDPAGGKTGKALPLGPVVEVTTPHGAYGITVTDMINPFVFADAADVALTAAEPFASLANDEATLEKIDAIRNAATVKLGWAQNPVEAWEKSPAVPKIAIVGPPRAYTTTSGETVTENDVDIVVRGLSMGRLHRTFPGSGLYCLAGSCLLPGTVPARVCRPPQQGGKHRIRIGHPDGIAEVYVTTTPDGQGIASLEMVRTARRIIKGLLYIPDYT